MSKMVLVVAHGKRGTQEIRAGSLEEVVMERRSEEGTRLSSGKEMQRLGVGEDRVSQKTERCPAWLQQGEGSGGTSKPPLLWA